MFLIAGLLVNTASAQKKPPVPEQYQKYFAHYVDKRSFWEKALNVVGLTGQDIGRSFAVIAGVSQYPNMPPLDRNLSPAAEDMRKLEEYLKKYEFFDEIVVLKNADMNFENLTFFLQGYFPERLRRFRKSRFLFAYSGHGMNEGGKGYLLLNTARNLSDKQNSLNLSYLRILINEVVDSGHHVLVLLNSCYGGVFLKRPFGGPKKFIPRNPGAHAITAGGSSERVWHDPEIGNGSIFFEKLFAGLDGPADISPKHTDGSTGDGVITVEELATYLTLEIKIFTDQNQNPQPGDISRNRSLGSFFFLNRRPQVDGGVLPEWTPAKKTPFGINARQFYLKGKEYYDAGDYRSAFTCFRQSAEGGDADGINSVGRMYYYGYEVKQDYAEGVRWFRKAADAGSGRGMFNLGLAYETGQGVPQDYNETMSWYLKSADTGQANAMTNLGNMHGKGTGLPKDFVQAAHWYRKGADMGSTQSMVNLGQVYSFGGFGLEKDYAEAVRWFLLGAEAGSAQAMYHLGTFYELGRGGTQDHEKAQYWFCKSAETGDEWVIDQLRRPSAAFKDKLSRIVNAAYDQFKDWKKPGSETKDGKGNVEWDPILSLSNGIGSNKLKLESYEGENYIRYSMEILIPKDLKQADELWNEYFAEIEEAVKSIQRFRVRSKGFEKEYFHGWNLEKTGFLGRALDQVSVWLIMFPGEDLWIWINRMPD
jgi:TPR repeat protein